MRAPQLNNRVTPAASHSWGVFSDLKWWDNSTETPLQARQGDVCDTYWKKKKSVMAPIPGGRILSYSEQGLVFGKGGY